MGAHSPPPARTHTHTHTHTHIHTKQGTAHTGTVTLPPYKICFKGTNTHTHTHTHTKHGETCMASLLQRLRDARTHTHTHTHTHTRAHRTTTPARETTQTTALHSHS